MLSTIAGSGSGSLKIRWKQEYTMIQTENTMSELTNFCGTIKFKLLLYGWLRVFALMTLNFDSDPCRFAVKIYLVRQWKKKAKILGQ